MCEAGDGAGAGDGVAGARAGSWGWRSRGRLVLGSNSLCQVMCWSITRAECLTKAGSSRSSSSELDEDETVDDSDTWPANLLSESCT